MGFSRKPDDRLEDAEIVHQEDERHEDNDRHQVRNDNIHLPLPLGCAVDHRGLDGFARHGLEAGIKNDEAERQDVPYAVDDQHGPRQHGRGLETQRTVVIDQLQRRTDDPVTIDHPEEDHGTYKRCHHHRQERDEYRRPLEQLRQAVDTDRDCKSQDQNERCDHECVGQGESQRLVKGQIRDLRKKGTNCPGSVPSLSDFLQCEMGPVGVRANTVEPAERPFPVQFLRRAGIDQSRLGTSERTATFRDDDHLFMFDVQGLNEDRDDR